MQSGPTGAEHVELEVVADMEHAGRGDADRAAGMTEDAWIRLADAELVCGDVGAEVVPDADAIDVLYYDTPYYVVPADDLAEEAYVVLRDALKKTRKVGVGQLAVRGQELLVSLKPCGRGLILETLRYADEVNKAANYFREVGEGKPDAELLDLATALIDKRSGEFDASEYHNRYVDALKGLIEEKRKKKGELVIQDPDDDKPVKGSNVIDLMAALKKSLGDDSGGGANDNKGTKKPAARKASSATPGAPRHSIAGSALRAITTAISPPRARPSAASPPR